MMRVIRHFIRRFKTNEQGNAVIEFVTTLPLILIAFVFAFEFSRLFWVHHIATNNVRSATRYLSRAPLTSDFVTDARNIARTGDPDTATGAYDWMASIQDSDIDIQTSHATFSSADFRQSGQVIRIQMDVPFTFATFGLFNNLGDDGLITLNIIEEARHYGE